MQTSLALLKKGYKLVFGDWQGYAKLPGRHSCGARPGGYRTGKIAVFGWFLNDGLPR
jgi:hypothetical protein